MENLLINLTHSLLIVFIMHRLYSADYKPLCVSVKRVAKVLALVLIFSSVLFIEQAYADGSVGVDPKCKVTGLFGDLICKGAQIFNGIRDIIYVVAGFGIIGVSVGGFFGNMNWKWLGAIVIGLMVIGLTGSVISFVGADDTTAEAVGNTLR